MFKNRMIQLLLAGVMMLSLAACSSTGSKSSTTTAAAGAQGAVSLQLKLAMGTLKLEGTAQAVTAQQAKDLLFLWKAVKSLSSSSTVSTTEMEALYKQIESTMTGEQVSAINGMSLTREEMSALAQQYGVQFGGFAGGGGAAVAGTQTAGTTGNNAGQMMGGGMPPDMGAGGLPAGGMPAGGFPGESGSQRSSGSSSAARSTRVAASGMSGAASNPFLDVLIKLLTERAAG